MAWPALFLDRGRNPLSIIPDSQPKQTFSVRNLSFDIVSVRVMERISECLAGDAVNLVPNDRVQMACRTFHH
jgi:hypothetical protein